MPLINLTTNLKSNEFGHDRAHGGSSKQPYIQTPIPEGDTSVLSSQDFVLRGGLYTVRDSAEDVLRLGKYFTDIRNPSGLLFTAKQNLLSRLAVRTQASGFLLNDGIYTPLSTLAQAGGVAFGLHVNKQGLNPFSGLLSAGTSTPNQYADDVQIGSNRLEALYGIKIISDNKLYAVRGAIINPGDVNILSYKGGPGSILGIGNTNIKFATGNGSNSVRTGKNNYFAKGTKESQFFGSGSYVQQTEYLDRYGNYLPIPPEFESNINRFLGLSGLYFTANSNTSSSDLYNTSLVNVISPISKIITVEDGIYNTYSKQQLIDIPGPSEVGVEYNGQSFHIGKSGVTTPGDFRTLLRNKQTSTQKDYETPQFGSLTNAPIYTEKNIEQRVLLGDPGNRSGKNLTSYVNGSGGGAASVSSYDEINASKVGAEHQNDLVKFRIGVINNDNPSTVTNIQFRAFLNGISDQYSSDWQPTRYIGRGENFYTYAGFDRKVSLSWTVAAQSKKELIPMYKKLNYLASICAPDYSGNGYMRGNIVKLTIGGYFYEQPGIITGLSYEMNDDNATWEIGIPDMEAEGNFYDPSVKELPHLIKVTGFNFIPIHTFVPRLTQNPNTGTEERYIALANGIGLESTNYKA